MREELLGHLLGALDDCEQESFEARLQAEPQLHDELAVLRQQIEPLEALRCDATPPAGLADRTCGFVFAQAQPAAAGARRRAMTPAAGAPSWIARIGWVDLAIAAGIFGVAALLVVPAVHNSRFRAQRTFCQDNLRDLGVALTQYSETHNNYFPRIPTRGPLAVAGVWAPTLFRGEYLTEAHRVLCPGSPLAEQGDFHLPSLEEVQSAADEERDRLRTVMGGSFGYALGYMAEGVYHDTRNLRRPHVPVMADAPTSDLPGHQSLNHGGYGQNFLFEDGGVQFLTFSWLDDDGDDDFFTNDEGEIAAGLHWNDAVIAPSHTPPLGWNDH